MLGIERAPQQVDVSSCSTSSTALATNSPVRRRSKYPSPSGDQASDAPLRTNRERQQLTAPMHHRLRRPASQLTEKSQR